MSRVQYALASYMCKGRPCPHHTKLAAELMVILEDARQLDREEEAKKALDRLAKPKEQL